MKPTGGGALPNLVTQQNYLWAESFFWVGRTTDGRSQGSEEKRKLKKEEEVEQRRLGLLRRLLQISVMENLPCRESSLVSSALPLLSGRFQIQLQCSCLGKLHFLPTSANTRSFARSNSENYLIGTIFMTEDYVTVVLKRKNTRQLASRWTGKKCFTKLTISQKPFVVYMTFSKCPASDHWLITDDDQNHVWLSPPPRLYSGTDSHLPCPRLTHEAVLTHTVVPLHGAAESIRRREWRGSTVADPGTASGTCRCRRMGGRGRPGYSPGWSSPPGSEAAWAAHLPRSRRAAWNLLLSTRPVQNNTNLSVTYG